VWRWLAEIPDPEVPAISIVDLGIVREVREECDGGQPVTVVTITPTYSGCPAMDMIAHRSWRCCAERGVGKLRLETRLSPPWTTDGCRRRARATARVRNRAACAGSRSR
jgi:ring-1,2-phenylacetyl-CoA epoxidase subunit PaaD